MFLHLTHNIFTSWISHLKISHFLDVSVIVQLKDHLVNVNDSFRKFRIIILIEHVDNIILETIACVYRKIFYIFLFTMPCLLQYINTIYSLAS